MKKKGESNQDKPVGMRNVIALGFVSFFTDFSTEMILGILPLFIVTNLGAPKAILGYLAESAGIRTTTTTTSGRQTIF